MASLQDHIETIDRYYRGGCEPGSCTRAILENDLLRAVKFADPTTRALLADIVTYVYKHLPMTAWGSPAKVDAWIRGKREELEELRGRQ